MSVKARLKQYSLIVSAYHFVRSVYQWIFYTHRRRLNVYKTVLVNFSLLPFRQACRFPIFIYGKVATYRLTGKAIIDAPLRRGMITFGSNTDFFGAPKGGAMLSIQGTVVFHGQANVSVDYAWDVSGTLEVGHLAYLGNNVRIRCWNYVVLGDMVVITVDTQIYDTNFHYIRHVETGEVYHRDEPIVVGKYCWIGNRTTLMKGCRLPDYATVASNSLVNKDMSVGAPLCPLYAGIPAVLKSSGIIRVFSADEERKIQHFFETNPNAQVYMGEKGLIDEYEEVLRNFLS